MRKQSNQQGVAFILFAGMIPIAVIFLAFVVNIGYLYLTKIELDFVTESAAHAGAVGLREGDDETTINDDVDSYIAANPVVSEVINSSEYEMDIGIWDNASRTFTVTADVASANAVRVETTVTRNYLFKGYIEVTEFTLNKSVIAVISTTSSDYTVTIIEE